MLWKTEYYNTKLYKNYKALSARMVNNRIPKAKCHYGNFGEIPKPNPTVHIVGGGKYLRNRRHGGVKYSGYLGPALP